MRDRSGLFFVRVETSLEILSSRVCHGWAGDICMSLISKPA